MDCAEKGAFPAFFPQPSRPLLHYNILELGWEFIDFILAANDLTIFESISFIVAFIFKDPFISERRNDFPLKIAANETQSSSFINC